MDDTLGHMKTTLVIDDGIMARLREEAARQGRTMSELVEAALRRMLEARPATLDLVELPGWESGGSLVDVADRDALYQAMEGR
jgi:plasmid stability protein